VEQRKLSGAIGGGLCAASFGSILASAASHLTGPGLYLFLIMVFLLGAVLFVRASGSGHVEVEGAAKPEIEQQQMLTLPPPSPPISHGTYSHARMEAEIEEPFVVGNLLRIYVRSKFGRGERQVLPRGIRDRRPVPCPPTARAMARPVERRPGILRHHRILTRTDRAITDERNRRNA
jgi:hypothetical protein